MTQCGFSRARVLTVAGLKADGVDAAGHAGQRVLASVRHVVAAPPPGLEDLLHRVSGGEVDGYGAELARLVQALGDVVDDVDVRRAAQAGAVGCEQADRARAEDDHAVARRHTSQLGGVVAAREGVGQKHEVVLVLVARLPGQAQTVGVGEGHAQQLGLRPAVVAHAGVAVGRAGLRRVGHQAGGAAARHAAGAEATADVGRHRDPVARPD